MAQWIWALNDLNLLLNHLNQQLMLQLHPRNDFVVYETMFGMNGISLLALTLKTDFVLIFYWNDIWLAWYL